MPDLGLWRPLGNTIIENTSTPWPNTFNDCKDMCGIIMLQLKCHGTNVAAKQTVTTFCPYVTAYRPNTFLSLRWAKSVMRASKYVSRRMSYSMLISDICVTRSFVMVVRSLFLVYFSFENERSPLQFVTIIIKYIRNAISTFGNEHLTRIYDKLVKKMFFADVVVYVFQELIRKGNQLNKLIAKTLL